MTALRLLIAISALVIATILFASPESDLSSPSQEVRDAAAKTLRDTFNPPPQSKWDSLMSEIKPGITKADVLELLHPLSRFGAGMGTKYVESYQLDNVWALTCFYKYNGYPPINNDDLLIKSELAEKMRSVWVNPPPDFTGVWITYYANGSKSFVIHYNHNVKEDETGFYPSGHINYNGSYKGGAEIGKWIWYNEDGSIKSTKDYSKP